MQKPKEYEPAHFFSIPVMGTSFTIDTPLHIARYGISSVVSIVDDELIEQMREYHCKQEGMPYDKITNKEEDARARRITEYLNLMGTIVNRQVEMLQISPFEPGSDITRYYEMLPESMLKQSYSDMLAASNTHEKARMQDKLRTSAIPGGIDVNIMTKLDCDAYRHGQKLPKEYSDAMAALRGYAKSDLNSSIVFSAGLNQKLYSYMTEFDDFFPKDNNPPKKRIILKVSDFRSAEVQGKLLAKKGLWVSEYRIESGLLCGGHTFPTNGHLMGPILEEFRQRKNNIMENMSSLYQKALGKRGIDLQEIPKARLTVQGGITTGDEIRLLRYYDIDGVGTATPFLLVPEVTNVDRETLDKLVKCTDHEVFLSKSSPLGILFWNLRNCGSEINRRKKIREGNPGSKCPKGYLIMNTDFTTKPVCTASSAYIKLALKRIDEMDYGDEELALVREEVLARSCICDELGHSGLLAKGIRSHGNPVICPSPTIADFSDTYTLEQMINHIYGRAPIQGIKSYTHMFIRELNLYVDYFNEELERFRSGLLKKIKPDYFKEFRKNLLSGIEYYRHTITQKLPANIQKSFSDSLNASLAKLNSVNVE